MRRLRVVITGGAVPVLVATLLQPACGERSGLDVDVDADVPVDSAPDTRERDAAISFADTTPVGRDASALCEGAQSTSYFVSLPPPGTPAVPGQICAISQGPVTSNLAARVLITNYSSTYATAKGFVSIDPALAKVMIGFPTVSVVSATSQPFASMKVTNMAPAPGGFQFDASWPPPLPHIVEGVQTVFKTSFLISCGDSGTQTVESITKVDYCVDTVNNLFDWVSSGDVCVVCVTVIAEMAPSPIVSDNMGDDLPLGRVVRVRVVEVARAGNQVLLFAENDAGDALEIEWRVSGGTLERVADDVMLWSLPDDPHAFGQVAAWSDVGAGVENFVRGYA